LFDANDGLLFYERSVKRWSDFSSRVLAPSERDTVTRPAMPYRHRRPVPVVAYSPTSAAAATELRPERIAAAIRDGSLRAVRVGTKTRIIASDLVEWLRSHAPASRAA